ncbi:DUF4249 family protein [Mucilaginibacter sp. SG564]|uniref:DUF4249 family protein n=1 Tax=Mucilaginibacter sp. SG564 TaxID=2587022 RepID=UPI001555DBCC|nr:DUF4249 family protein [Mucilaginibacter sp. SG564]NOW93822.1 hypothetical protein [Mucilaginibacter sp. SG564]
MKRNLYFIWLTGIIFMVTTGCKKNNLNSTGQPVVQAYLLAGHPITVNLYQQKSLTDTANYGPAITGQQLYISDGSKQIQLTETTKGTYTSNDSTFLVSGKTYSLSFKYLSQTVSAKTVMPYKPQNFQTQYGQVYYENDKNTTRGEIDTLNKFTWDNPDSLNHVLVFDNIEKTTLPLRAGIISNSGSYQFIMQADRKSVYFVESDSFPYYGNFQVVLLSVNQEYADLLKSNTLGSNSQNLLNTPTNVVNGIGIFTAFQSDTLSFILRY